MKHFFLLFLALSILISLNAQDPGKTSTLDKYIDPVLKPGGTEHRGKSLTYYNTGVKEFKKGKQAAAIASFSQSILESQTIDAYFDRGMVYKSMGDTCNYCGDLRSAMEYGDREAENLYLSNCTVSILLRNEVLGPSYKDDGNSYTIHTDRCKGDTVIIIKRPVGESGFSGDEPEFVVVEQMPSFPTGEDGLKKYLANNLKYPMEAKVKEVSGTVYASFIVEKDGTITHVQVLRGIGGGCDEESIRVIKGFPKWNPGMQNGKPVRVKFSLPIKFTL